MESICNYCNAVKEGQQCSGCHNVFYCSKECQKHDWKRHKRSCLKKVKTIQACIVDGAVITEKQIPFTKKNNLSDRLIWHECIVPTMLGVPLVVRHIGPSSVVQNREIAVFFMVNPNTGLAPYEWMSHAQKKLGKLLFSRSDGLDLSKDLLWSLYNYIFDLMDLYSDGELEKIKTKKLKPDAFNRFKEDEDIIQANYRRQLLENKF